MERSAFDQLVSKRVLIGDGAMGTMLYQFGVFLNRCFDELNLSDPSLVRKVHNSYVEAGADFIETNTFGVNRLKLSKFGLAAEAEQINRAGVRIAREAAQEGVLVAGAMGPLGSERTGHSPITTSEVRQIFAEQGGALIQADVDLLILETFSNTEELLIAIEALGGVGEAPIIAQMTVDENHQTVYGVRNLLIITGDPPKMGEYPSATGVFDMDSIALTTVVRNLNRGVDIGGNAIDPPTSLVIGVGANPVAADLGREIERFRQKVLAGAEFAVTQPVFAPECLCRFLDATRGATIPIIAGIWPFTSFKNAEFMANEVPGVVVPKVLLDRMSRATTKEHGRALGIEIAQELVAKIRNIVAGFAVSAPFGNVATALAVLGKVDVGVA